MTTPKPNKPSKGPTLSPGMAATGFLSSEVNQTAPTKSKSSTRQSVSLKLSHRLPEYDSISSCAAGTGIPLSVLRAAKAAGCPAFRHSRVSLRDFLPWFFSQKDQGKLTPDNARLRLILAQARRQESMADREEGKVVSAADVTSAWAARFDLAKSVLTGSLERELPPQLAGLATADIVPIMRQTVEKICNAMAASVPKPS